MSGKRQLRHVVSASFVAMALLAMALPAAQAQVTEEWVARYNGPANFHDRATAMAFDSVNDRVYVTGFSEGSGTGQDYATVAYDSSTGNELWVARYNGPGNYTDVAKAIAYDSVYDRVYVTGYSEGNGTGNDYATVAYDSSTGNELWVARYGSYYDQRANAIATDSNGNVYVTGERSGGGFGAYGTIAYDSSGNQLWLATYDTGGSDAPCAIAFVKKGNDEYVYVTGWSAGAYATVAYDAETGTQRWVARYGPKDYNQPFAMATASNGNVYVTGRTRAGGGYNDYATVAYDSSGNQLWEAIYNGPGNAIDNGLAIAYDSVNDRVYVTGGSQSTINDYGTIAYDAETGAQLWLARFNTGTSDVAGAIAYDSVNDRVYVTGGGGGSYPPNYITVAYDSSGNQVGVHFYNGPANNRDGACAIATDKVGNVYVTGTSVGIADDYATLKLRW